MGCEEGWYQKGQGSEGRGESVSCVPHLQVEALLHLVEWRQEHIQNAQDKWQRLQQTLLRSSEHGVRGRSGGCEALPTAVVLGCLKP